MPCTGPIRQMYACLHVRLLLLAGFAGHSKHMRRWLHWQRGCFALS